MNQVEPQRNPARAGELIIKRENNLANIFFALLSLVFLFLGSQAQAAELFFDSANKTVGLGQTIEMPFFINTQGEVVNAVDGAITYPKDMVEIQEVRDGDSVITLWVDQPSVAGGKLAFSGVTPGGYRGDHGRIFSVVFKAIKSGEIVFTPVNNRVLLNDGQGTLAKLAAAPFHVSVSDNQSVSTPSSEIIDNDPPEVFVPSVVRDNNIEGNKWFVVFATEDKGVGIDHYEIQESAKNKPDDSRWAPAESPFFLKNQALSSYIFVKAVDKKGNQRIAVIPPSVEYEKYIIWGILIVGFSLILGRLWDKRRGKNF